MAVVRIQRLIQGDAPGRQTQLNYFRIGAEDAPKKVYLQAALHADEQPGILILHYLLQYLIAADEQGLLRAQFVVFPMVNPLGMANINFQLHQGRYDPQSGVNFNRRWPALETWLDAEALADLGDDVVQNQQLIRTVLANVIAKQVPVTALQQQRHYVLQEAHNADYVFDLHCDTDSIVHIFSVPQLNPVIQELADWIGAEAILTAEDSGGGSFDEVWPNTWLRLAEKYPDKAIPSPPVAATLEYRGQWTTSEQYNQADAKRLYGFFQEQGLISGKPIQAKPTRKTTPTPFAATDIIRVQQAGLLIYRVKLGDCVEAGQVVADVLSLDGEAAFTALTPVVSSTAGKVISLNLYKYVWRGCSIAKVVGKEILASRGDYLLED